MVNLEYLLSYARCRFKRAAPQVFCYKAQRSMQNIRDDRMRRNFFHILLRENIGKLREWLRNILCAAKRFRGFALLLDVQHKVPSPMIILLDVSFYTD